MAANKKNDGRQRKGSVRQSAKPSDPVYRADCKNGNSKVFQSVLQRIQALTPEEFRESLRAVGIIDKSGKLTKPYRS
jgi:hypothetical protein